MRKLKKERGLMDMSVDVQIKLDRYRELYNKWQNRRKEQYNEELVELSNDCLLMQALDEAIATMLVLLPDESKEEKR